MTPKEVPPVVSQGSFHPLAEVHYGCGGKEVEVQHLMMGKKDAKKESYELHGIFCWFRLPGRSPCEGQRIQRNFNNRLWSTKVILSDFARSYGRRSCHLDRQGHIENVQNDKDLTAREMFLPAVERAATGFGSLRSFQDLKVWKSGHY